VECSALRALRATPDEGVRGYTCAGRLGVFGIHDGEPRSCTSCSFEHFGWVSLYANVVLCPCREIYVRCWWSFAWWIFATKSGFFEAGWYRIPPSPPAKVVGTTVLCTFSGRLDFALMAMLVTPRAKRYQIHLRI
jgi:hypothetical protein